MDSKKKVAIIATIILLIVLLDATKISSFEFYFNKLFALKNSEELAADILLQADILYDKAAKNKPFITDLSNTEFTIFYTDLQKDRKTCTISVKDVPNVTTASEFIKYYDNIAHFAIGFDNELMWRYETKKKDTLVPYLTVVSRLLSSQDNYNIMSKRPHVETDGKLVEAIKERIPFKIQEGTAFFVIDETTREMGWFYFKSSYNGTDFVGCYDVDGWGYDVTYEELINLKDMEIQKVEPHPGIIVY